MKTKINTIEETVPQLKGKYISAIGKRKSAVAQIRLYKNGTGEILINGAKASEYFSEDDLKNTVSQPLKLTGHTKDLNFSVVVNGGGKKGQAQAIRHGVALSLIELDKDSRPSLKTKGLVTRDARIKERKKPGLKKARRAPQWSKR